MAGVSPILMAIQQALLGVGQQPAMNPDGTGPRPGGNPPAPMPPPDPQSAKAAASVLRAAPPKPKPKPAAPPVANPATPASPTIEQQYMAALQQPELPPAKYNAPEMGKMDPKVLLGQTILGLLFKKLALPASEAISSEQGALESKYTRDTEAAQAKYTADEAGVTESNRAQEARANNLERALAAQQAHADRQAKIDEDQRLGLAKLKSAFDISSARDKNRLTAVAMQDFTRLSITGMDVQARMNIAGSHAAMRDALDKIRLEIDKKRLSNMSASSSGLTEMYKIWDKNYASLQTEKSNIEKGMFSTDAQKQAAIADLAAKSNPLDPASQPYQMLQDMIRAGAPAGIISEMQSELNGISTLGVSNSGVQPTGSTTTVNVNTAPAPVVPAPAQPTSTVQSGAVKLTGPGTTATAPGQPPLYKYRNPDGTTAWGP